jgi:hypothetical protein
MSRIIKWLKSSRCESSMCLEVAFADGAVFLRETTDGTSITVTDAEWDAFLAAAKAGEFDRPGQP